MSADRSVEPGTNPGDREARAVRAWVALYTRGLPADIAADRRAEIESDLWDESTLADRLGQASGLGRQRTSRWIRGMPADAVWRLEHRGRGARAPWRMTMHISKLELAAIGIATVVCCVAVVGLMASPSFLAWSGMVPALIGLGLAIVGLLLAVPKPKEGLAVGLAGVGLAFLAMWWLFPFYLPVLIALAFRYARGQRSPEATTGT